MSIAKKILITIYSLIILLATVFMFTYTPFSNSSLGNVTIIGLDKKINNYSKGNLLIAKKTKINKNDKILFYDIINGKSLLTQATVEQIINTNKKEITYVIKNNKFISSDYVVSNTKNTYTIPLLGYAYLFLTNKYTYLVSVIIPVLAYFMYQIRNKKNA